MAAEPTRLTVMIAGIGGASLGTELLKCLHLAGRYDVFGCDVSNTAYGLYDEGFRKTFLTTRDDYVGSVIRACREAGARWLLPGGEQPTVLLGAALDQLRSEGIGLVANDAALVAQFSDKAASFERLRSLGIAVPRTVRAGPGSRFDAEVGLPCIVKPATGTGGSTMVFFATSEAEADAYAEHITRAGGTPVAQEYIQPDEGEFTVGVLSTPDGDVAGSVALRRSLDAKLSVLSRDRGGVVSSGYSQGFIGDFPGIRQQAEAIARAIGSRGPINVQGRVRDGRLLPFEINPRLSASSYLRAMAGFNEPDLLLQHLAFGTPIVAGPLRVGWYLRSLTERFIPDTEVRR